MPSGYFGRCQEDAIIPIVTLLYASNMRTCITVSDLAGDNETGVLLILSYRLSTCSFENIMERLFCVNLKLLRILEMLFDVNKRLVWPSRIGVTKLAISY